MRPSDSVALKPHPQRPFVDPVRQQLYSALHMRRTQAAHLIFAGERMITPVLPTYSRADLAFERGEGAWLHATDGTRYLDFGAGIAVNSLGHAHPHLVEALTDQARKLWHTSNLYRIP